MHSPCSSPNENRPPSRPKSGHPVAVGSFSILYIDIHMQLRQTTYMHVTKSGAMLSVGVEKVHNGACDCLRRETKMGITGSHIKQAYKRHSSPSSILFCTLFSSHTHTQTQIPSWQSFHLNLQYTIRFQYWMLGTNQSQNQRPRHPLLTDNIIDPRTITPFPFQMIRHPYIMSITINIQGGIAQLIVVCIIKFTPSKT